ncbi:MAG: FAD-dependent oxidoreductase [Alphaproteobacteria bacterium]|nr:FAD-dependent oxidoreductase [Alphaproteobacteria bacterium]MCB9795784.1 FAD-dependent oxidoreductase [Alphaproteobacteria bacterium]
MSRSALFDRLQHLMGVAQLARQHGTRDLELLRGLASAPSRREVLASAATTLTLSALPLGASGCRRGGDVVIVGGGLAGTTCAYRLHQAGQAFTLYDANDRLGGRTFTGRGLFADDQTCELGGELIDSNHATLWALAEELGITLDDRSGGALASLTPETFQVEGALVSDEVLLEQLIAVVDDISADFDAAETDDDAYAALDLEPLSDWLQRRIPRETYPELHVALDVAYRGEFGLENDEQSALNLIYLLGLETDAFRIFGTSDERWHAHEGSDAFVSRMADALPEGAAVLEHRLTRVEGSGPFTLTFEGPDGELVVDADKVVFALPFSTLRDVDLSGLELSDDKREIIDALGYGTNAKVMAGFTRPVWREDHGASGTATADLPFQQSWDSSLGQDGASAIMTDFLGGDQGVACGDGEAEAWVEDVLLPGLEALFPGTSDAWDGSAARMHWPTVSTAKGSYTCYRPGQWAWWSTEGEQEGDLHFCGEHASADFQGWMEGAAESGQRVAEEILNDLGVELPGQMRGIASLWRSLPPIRGERRNAIRSLRARRAALRAWAQQQGRG